MCSPYILEKIIINRREFILFTIIYNVIKEKIICTKKAEF